MTAYFSWCKGASLACGWLRRVMLLAVVAASSLLAACQHMAFMENPAEKAAALVADLPPPVEREWPAAGPDVLNQRALGYGLVRMPEMQQYLNTLLAKIKTEAGVPEWPGSVYILASAPLEAYATAAGNIYISQSWLTSIESEDEMVALLAHEFGHIYLHYHQLEGAIQTTDIAANVSTLAIGLASKGAELGGWGAMDSFAASYTAGRALVSSAWGRSQESAADSFGMNISIKLGYSYEAGFKTLLERIASWEEDNAVRQAAAEEKLLEQVRQKAEQSIRDRNEEPNSDFANALYEPLAKFAGMLESLVHQGFAGISSLWSDTTAMHPDTVARLDSLAAAVDIMPPEALPTNDAVVAPWQRALKQRQTAQILKNYALSMRAMSNLDDAGAFQAAQAGASGATATHAFPLHVLFQVQRANALKQGHGLTEGVFTLFNSNIKQEDDRAWISYVESAELLRFNGRHREADQVMSDGFRYFLDAPYAWPQAIAFFGDVRGWDTAKALAVECRQRFSTMARECTKASASPAEKEQIARETEQKAQQLVNKLMGKKR